MLVTGMSRMVSIGFTADYQQVSDTNLFDRSLRYGVHSTTVYYVDSESTLQSYQSSGSVLLTDRHAKSCYNSQPRREARPEKAPGENHSRYCNSSCAKLSGM